MKLHLTVMALFGKTLQLHADISQTFVHFKTANVDADQQGNSPQDEMLGADIRKGRSDH